MKEIQDELSHGSTAANGFRLGAPVDQAYVNTCIECGQLISGTSYYVEVTVNLDLISTHRDTVGPMCEACRNALKDA